MNNIKKFQQMKELARLKSEYHKHALLDLMTFSTDPCKTEESETGIVDLTLTGVTLYQQIMEIKRQREDA